MRYFSQKDLDEYQAARKTPATERDFCQMIEYEAGLRTLRQAGIEILPKEMIPTAPPCIIMISRRPWIKKFDGVVIHPEDAIARYELETIMGDPMEDVKKLLNIVFGEGKIVIEEGKNG